MGFSTGGIPYTKEQRIAAFWSRVSKTDSCWLWTGAKTSAGYPAMSIGHVTKLAHRFSYELANGPIPKGQLVLHSCDTPLCVRPDHLSLGTDADNVADKVRKGRAQSKITKEQAAEIKQRLQDPYYGINKELADKYGISAAQVSSIRSGKRWRHV